jgi:nucleotide-binding universal stress UspA family protein
MPANNQLELAIPDIGGPARGDGPPPLRILAPVGLPGQSEAALTVAARLAAAAGGQLLLTHVRIFDPPMPGCPGGFCAETVDAAAALLDDALLTAWAVGAAGATAAIVNAARADVPRAIARQAASWGAGLIVMTRRPRPAISCLLLGSDVPDQVMRAAQCPVLAVPTEGRFSRHARG